MGAWGMRADMKSVCGVFVGAWPSINLLGGGWWFWHNRHMWRSRRWERGRYCMRELQ